MLLLQGSELVLQLKVYLEYSIRKFNILVNVQHTVTMIGGLEVVIYHNNLLNKNILLHVYLLQ